MKKEKECYEVPRADIVDIRMEGSLLEGSDGGYGKIVTPGGEESPFSGGFGETDIPGGEQRPY